MCIRDRSYNEELRKLFAKDFIGKIKEFRNLSTIGEITRFLFEYLEKHKVQKKIQSSIDMFLSEIRYKESSEYSQVWNYIMEIFEQLLLVGEDRQISALEYRKILEAGLKEVKVSIIPPTIDQVEIGDIDRISIGHPKALFIMGANEGKLDSSSENGLLLDEEREVLIENKIDILNGSTFVYYKGIHMLYKAFSCPKERLFVSYSQGTIDGKSLQPSLYISTLKKIFPNIIEETDISGFKEIDYVSNSRGTYDILVENIRKHMEGKRVDDIWKSVYTWYKNNDIERFSIIHDGFNYKNTVKPLNSKVMDEIYEDNITITVSNLGFGFKTFPTKYLNGHSA